MCVWAMQRMGAGGAVLVEGSCFCVFVSVPFKVHCCCACPWLWLLSMLVFRAAATCGLAPTRPWEAA